MWYLELVCWHAAGSLVVLTFLDLFQCAPTSARVGNYICHDAVHMMQYTDTYEGGIRKEGQ